VKNLLGSFGLIDKVIAFVTNKGTNMGTMIARIKHIVSCALLDLLASFSSTC
jgi:hypothetical protein